MKRSGLFLAVAGLLLSFTLQAAESIPGNGRQKFNFNSDWLISVDDVRGGEKANLNDDGWKRVTLPHAWNEDDAFRLSIARLPTATVWYRKHFKLPAEAKGKKVFLEFEGIRFGGEFFVNGKSIGWHDNGVMAAGFDVSDYVKFGNTENVIAVRINNAWDYPEHSTGVTYQWNDRNFNANYGGIPKNVWLHIAEPVYQTLPLYSNLGTTGVYIYATNHNIPGRAAIIHAESQVKNETRKAQQVAYEVVMKDPDGKEVARFGSQPVTVPAGGTATLKAEKGVTGLHFWSWGYGYLYDVYTTLVVDGVPSDVVRTRTGFRKTQFGDGLIRINDRVLQMKGYAQRTSNEWPAVGMSVPAWVSDYSNRMIVEGNGNLVRWMHVTPWKQDVESCDRVGLIHAMPAGDAERDSDGRKWEQRVELMRDAIIYNRNNPSIVFYESGNKGISEEHMAEMKAVRDQYDPHGGRAIGSREMLASRISEWGGEMLYINKSGRMPVWATEYARDEALRKYWDEYSYPYHKNGAGRENMESYNQNQDSYAKQIVERWWDYYSQRPGTGRRVSSGGVNIIFSDSNTHYRGEENYRRSGEVDPMRIPKDAYFAHQVMWDGWVDVENYRSHIVGHWNYDAEVMKEVYVVSSGEAVELFLNGISQGMGMRSNHFQFTFGPIRWEPGTLTAVSYDAEMNEVSRAEIKTAGEPAAIRMTSMTAPDGFKADGQDLALLEFEVVDKDGLRCPLSNELIRFTVEGPAEWRGGIAQGEDNYILSKELPVECGINRAFVRSTTQAGTITVKAEANGLAPATIILTTVPFETKDGLATYISGEHQPYYLSRGETPATPSYEDSRFSVRIVGAQAGVNQEIAVNSYDDNEFTEWANDGKLSTGWITYELEREAVISEVMLKLTGWRSRSYPIRILIDGNEVYRGNTERSLGYVTISIPQVKGKEVTIALFGESEESDAFGSIVEITGGVELDLFRDPRAQESDGQLRIVEVEFYEKDRTAPKPLYRDPIYDGAADPVVIWNKHEKRWFMFYTNRRANAEGETGVTWVHNTPIGIAESADGGTTWTYRGDANINYGAEDYTYWAPDVIEAEDGYHMFLTVPPGTFEDWQHPRNIVHLTSQNLIDWEFHSVVPLATEKVIDASLIRDEKGLWWMFYNDEISGKTIFYATSPDLYNWTDHGQIVRERGEGPKVFRWRGKYWMAVDTWSGQAFYHSDDLKNWTKQPELILDKPGTGIEDGVVGNHADVVVNGDRAYIFYFTHPGRAERGRTSFHNSRRSSIQVAELQYVDGKIVCNRDEPTRINLLPEQY